MGKTKPYTCSKILELIIKYLTLHKTVATKTHEATRTAQKTLPSQMAFFDHLWRSLITIEGITQKGENIS